MFDVVLHVRENTMSFVQRFIFSPNNFLLKQSFGHLFHWICLIQLRFKQKIVGMYVDQYTICYYYKLSGG